jgi:hypothetical protein
MAELTPPTKFQPPDYNIYKGETLVQVISPGGQRCGEFPWPNDSLWMLSVCNGSIWGYHFAFNVGDHHVNGTLGNPRLPGMDALKPKE